MRISDVLLAGVGPMSYISTELLMVMPEYNESRTYIESK